MYDDQKLFKLEDYVQISGFLNTFVYKIISNNLIGMANNLLLLRPPIFLLSNTNSYSRAVGDPTSHAVLSDAKSLPTSSLFQSLHALLLLLYKRDCRRQFAPKNHWIIREIKISFLSDVEKNKKWALVSGARLNMN